MDGKPVPHGAFADFIRKQILVLSYDRFIQTVQTPMFQMPAVVKPTKKADDNSGGLDQSGPDSSPPTQSKACGIVINRRASYHPEGSIASGSQVPQRSSAKPPVIYASKNTPVTVNNRQTSTPIVYTGPALEVVAQAMVLTLTSEKIAAAQVHLLVKLAFSSGILQFVRVDPPKEL
ncbi:hypothetical protein H4R34_002996 [Dimargaris verticillata]|uniref:Uncharacterized protein n=1 Tax=Dimargaris verticillata TaxID=2761393 RepID=A0A9W8B5F2_9FUNG|nr:hypothetical protein H4R34_002996 [Dimargaris verticillata]